jgi:CP family cyanate transporter-like MFS transporter
VTAEHVQRRVWPYLVFGPAALAGVLGILWASGTWVVVAAGLLGFSLSITFVVTFALLPALSLPDEIHRMSAGMFTIGFCCAVILPIICGVLWDLTGVPWTAFVPLGVCAVTLTVLGVALSLYRRPATAAAGG